MPSDSKSLESQLIDLKQESERLEAQLSKVFSPTQGAPYLEGQHGSPLNETRRNVFQQVQERVRSFLQIRNEDFVRSVFLKYADADSRLVETEMLAAALNEFKIGLTAEEANAITTSMDIDNNGGLDFQEFTRALNLPSTQVEQFIKTLPVTGMLANCFTTQGAADPLKALCDLSCDQLKDRMEVFAPIFLREVLEPELNKLKKLLKAQEEQVAGLLGSKFSGFCMNAGSILDFHEGPYKRIGGHALSLKLPLAKDCCSIQPK